MKIAWHKEQWPEDVIFKCVRAIMYNAHEERYDSACMAVHGGAHSVGVKASKTPTL